MIVIISPNEYHVAKTHRFFHLRLSYSAARLMAVTTLMSGMFWGMTRAVVQTTMHFQPLDLCGKA